MSVYPPLQLEALTKKYPAKPAAVTALDNVDLELQAGEFVAVVGPSGGGKSTLLLTSGGLLRPDEGQVRVAGKSFYDLDREARAALRARQVGFVFQDFHLVPYLNVKDNILAPSLAPGFEKLRSGPERAAELIDRLGLAERAQHLPSQLSVGERQRTALARALLGQPAVILADEPTGNLDPESTDSALAHLRSYVDEGGAVLLVTHDPRAAAASDRVLRLAAGRLETLDSKAIAPGSDLQELRPSGDPSESAQ